MIERIYSDSCSATCFFRSTVCPPNMKIMIQITERCNLKCQHCFVEAENVGNEMDIDLFKSVLVPKLIESNVSKVTLTGGEPMTHSNFEDIVFSLLNKGIGVSICTNGTLINQMFLNELSSYNNVHFNVSLDGFSHNSHGRFRGNMSQDRFGRLIENIRILGEMNLLNGILSTPNKYCSIEEYVELCKFAKTVGAKYLLMNPLSPFGRGDKTQGLSYSNEDLLKLKEATKYLISDDFEIVYIRFPNEDNLPVSECKPGSIPYVFCNGDVAICPYMVFASENETNEYDRNDFITGNAFEDDFVFSKSVKEFELFNETDDGRKEDLFNRGCIAIKISKNLSLYEWDNSTNNRKE